MRAAINGMPLLGKSEGVRRYVNELTRALAEIPSVDVRMFGGSTAGFRRLLVTPKLGFIGRQFEELAIDPTVMSMNSDVIHYTDTYGPIYPVSRPVVITVHDTTFVTHPEMHDGWVVKWLTTLARLSWPRAHSIIAVSEVTAEDIQSLGVAEDRIRVIPHGVDHAGRLPLGGPPLGLTAEKYFAYVGNIEPRKDLPTLVHAFRAARQSLPDDVLLAIAGKHAWGPELAALVAGDPRIRMVGWLSEHELSNFMANCLAFIYPSRYEGFGLPPLEALHLGARVIVGDTPVAREVLSDQVLYFDPGDVPGLAKLLRFASSTRDRPGDANAYTAEFTWQRAARRTLDVYREVVR